MGTEAAGILRTRVQERILGETTIKKLICKHFQTQKLSKTKTLFCTTIYFSGAAEAGDELRDCFAGPHAELGRAGDTPQPRPAGARIPARREDDAQQAQARHQVQAEEGDQRIDIVLDAFCIEEQSSV